MNQTWNTISVFLKWFQIQILCLKTDFAQSFGGFTLLSFVGLHKSSIWVNLLINWLRKVRVNFYWLKEAKMTHFWSSFFCLQILRNSLHQSHSGKVQSKFSSRHFLCDLSPIWKKKFKVSIFVQFVWVIQISTLQIESNKNTTSRQLLLQKTNAYWSCFSVFSLFI